MRKRTTIIIVLVVAVAAFVFFVPVVPEDLVHQPVSNNAEIRLPVQVPEQENPLGHKGRNPAEIGA